MIELAEEIEELVGRALAEDVGGGDVTSEATVPEDARARARIVQNSPASSTGSAVVAETMRQCGVEDVDNLVVEGQWREEVPVEVLSPAAAPRALLAAERTAINFLGHLSGVATLTARYAEAVVGDRDHDPRHPQDDAGAAAPGEGGRRRRRRAQPPARPLRRDPDQGEPRRPRRRPGEGGLRRPHRPARDGDRGRGPRRRRSRLRSRYRRRPAAARQHERRLDARGRSPCATRTPAGPTASR